jgi:hypothetical protein
MTTVLLFDDLNEKHHAALIKKNECKTGTVDI